RYLNFFGWFGVAIHELGHLVFCILFMQLVSDVKLFTRRPLFGVYYGWVSRAHINSHADNLRISSFFIGAGPVLIGASVIYVAGQILLGAEALSMLQFPAINETTLATSASLQALGNSIWSSLNLAIAYFLSRDNLQSWQFYLFVYIAFSVASAMTLSWPDIRTTVLGFATIIVALFILNAFTLWTGSLVRETVFDLAAKISPFYSLMLFVLMMNIVIALFVLLLYAFVSTVRTSFKKRKKR
ncbi:MAG: hypothetical protein ACE5I1_09285, partial [bacterium]